MDALAQVERDIRLKNPQPRWKYLRDFNEAFQTYESVLSERELQSALLTSDILLIGDYHALPRSQQSAAQVVEFLASSGRRVFLGLEPLLTSDQRILDRWLSGAISEAQLRSQTRYDIEWGYPWEPFFELLKRARSAGATIVGLDSNPRGNLRRIRNRDRHAAERLAEINELHPDAILVVLFGEAHVAPNHLPAEVQRLLPDRKLQVLLQNVDALYWQTADGPTSSIPAVRVQKGVICVFNATPLEKYESYRHCIEMWIHGADSGADRLSEACSE